MQLSAFIAARLPANPVAREALAAALALALGSALLPAVIYLAGTTLLGRYDGASLARTYSTVFSGLSAPSPAAWIVLLGPYLLYQLLRGLRLLWRVGAPPPQVSG